MENNIATEKVEVANKVTATPKKKVSKTTAAKKPLEKKVAIVKAEDKTIAPKANTLNRASNEIMDVVNSTANDLSQKVDFSKNVDKVKSSVKSLNDQIVASSSDIFNEVVSMNKEIAEIAVKSVKEVVDNMEIKEEVQKMKTTATEFNEKAITKVKELNAQVSTKAEELKSTTTKLATEMINNLKINERMVNVKDFVKNSNQYALEATDNAIDAMEKNATEWQKLTEKAVKKGFKLATKQQELVFETLEEVKNQVTTTKNNFSKLFSSKEA